MLNGAWNAVTGAIERALVVFRAGGYDPKVVLTGGDAERIIEHIQCDSEHRPHLVLQGLARMLGGER